MIIGKNNSNTLQAFWVGAGSLASFAFVLVSSMILTRYLAKEDYGTYRQVIYVYNTLLVVFMVGLPKAFSYFLPRVEMEQGRHLVKKITNLFYILGGLMSIALFFSSGLIASALGNQNLEVALKIFSPVPLFLLPTMGLESIYATYRKTHISAIYVILTNVLRLCFVALPVVFWESTFEIAVTGLLCASVFIFVIAEFLKGILFRKFERKDCGISYKQMLQYSLPVMYAGIFGAITLSADQFFISRYFGTKVFADFANGSLELPFVGMVLGAGTAVLAPLFSKHAYLKSDIKTEIYPLWINSFQKTIMLTYPLLLFCWVFADSLMVVLYGEAYETSSIFFRIKAIHSIFNLIWFAPLLLAIGKQKFFANVTMWTAFAIIVAEYLSIKIFDSPYAVTSVSVLCIIVKIFIFLAFIAKLFDVKIINLFPISMILKISIFSIIVLWGIKYLSLEIFGMSNLVALIFSLSLYGIVYLIYSHFVKINYMSMLKAIIKK